MAKSPAHRFGQIIGDLLEETIIDYCRPFAKSCEMYLDYKHPRAAREGKKEVLWMDVNGNHHKLDVVMEEDGSETQFGKPRAFIEIAWRRYTKHAKNKVQEISGAINPLVSKYKQECPFFGAVLAGAFTENALTQLKSEGFKIIYFSSSEIETALASQGIDGHWEESTTEHELNERIEKYEALTDPQIKQIKEMLLAKKGPQFDAFFQCLENSLQRKLVHIDLISLYGRSQRFSTVEDACQSISKKVSSLTLTEEDFYEYLVMIEYSNGDKIEMPFKDQQTALVTLKNFV